MQLNSSFSESGQSHLTNKKNIIFRKNVLSTKPSIFTEIKIICDWLTNHPFFREHKKDKVYLAEVK